MKDVYINKNGYLQSLVFKDCNIKIAVTDEKYDELMEGRIGFNWRYIAGEFIFEPLMDDDSLKYRRQHECFDIIDNRSPMWYNNLSQERKDELNAWYQAWLDVTETKVIPTKPEWL